jgi:hydroxypyruvate isomerase
MPRFTANIAFLFTEHPFLQRFAAAKAAGFDRVECHEPYEFPVAALREQLATAGVALTGLNTPRGGRAGDFGLAGVPGREAEFRRAIEQAAEYALALGVGMIHVMAGIVSPQERGAALTTYIENVRSAARMVASTGLTLLIEPINQRDVPGYLVSQTDEVAAIIAKIGEPNVRMLFDVYHVQITEGDLTRRLERHRSLIGHVQIAAVPSRAEPQGGLRDARRHRLRGARRSRIQAPRSHGRGVDLDSDARLSSIAWLGASFRATQCCWNLGISQALQARP